MIIDLLWIKDHSVRYVFEVESTTSMTSALLRGSNIAQSVPKIMLFPEALLKQFEKKMKTPMFLERYTKDNWNFIVFDNLYHEWNNMRTNINISEIAGVVNKPYKSNICDNNQLIMEF